MNDELEIMTKQRNAQEKPPFIYKYKAVSTKEDLIRLLDIFSNNRIYMPSYTQLNDPLEGEIISISVEGYAGCSIFSAADKEDAIVKQHKDDFRILSLAREYSNPQLWAHYANAYEGVCLCFATDGCFESIEEIEYCSDREGLFVNNDRTMNKEVRRSFFKKNSGWSYEKEWRIIRKCKRHYLKFKKSDLRGIIFGHRMSDEIRNFIVASIDKTVVKMRTDIGYRSFQINVLPVNYEYVYDGTPLKVLDVEKSLNRGKYIYRSAFEYD